MIIMMRYLACLALPLLLNPTVAGIHALDQTWYKLAVSANGYTIDSTTDVLKKRAFKTTAYMNVEWTGTEYAFHIFTNTGTATAPVWDANYDDFFSTEGANESLATDVYMDFPVANGDVGGFLTFLISVKKDASGAVKSVSLTSLGGEAVDGNLDGDEFRGGLSVRATYTTPAKLPFTP
jgi:hypothetical protein